MENPTIIVRCTFSIPLGQWEGKKQHFLIAVSCSVELTAPGNNSSEGEAWGRRKRVSCYSLCCLVVCAQGQGCRAEAGDDTTVVHMLSWQLQTPQCRSRERRGGGGHDYRCTLTPITSILWCKMTIIRQSRSDMIERLLKMHEWW